MEDSTLQRRVVEELKWDPRINDKDVAVKVSDGVVTLLGTVGSYPEKLACEKAVQRVRGVRGVRGLAAEIVVTPSPSLLRSDSDLAKAASDALEANSTLAPKHLKVRGEHGWIMLSGDVHWGFEKEMAAAAVCYLAGVKGVTNRIEVTPAISAQQVAAEIECALRRSAELHAHDIDVLADEGRVTLTGHVHSWQAKTEAARAAWAAPGVVHVDNQIVVGP
jgi:osmotically-inducible protein OsmY